MTAVVRKARIERSDLPASVAARWLAARSAAHVVDGGRTIKDALSEHLSLQSLSSRDQALTKEMAYGVVRWYWTLAEIARHCLKRGFREKDRDVFFLLLVGLYQLKSMRIPPHAAVDATVQACDGVRKPWLKGLINGVLRNYLRNGTAIESQITNEQYRTAHPRWLCEQLRGAWKKEWPRIVDANNAIPPQCLRVNLARIGRDAYLSRLQALGIKAVVDPNTETGLTLRKPMGAESLPGYNEGWFSVQDLAAQLVVPSLRLEPGQRVLDACAAPGGKTAHMLEREPELAKLVAVDLDPARLPRLRRNLERLGLEADCIAADAIAVRTWWDGQRFDRILVDAPCSGSGIIRRQPDIKHIRRVEDLERSVIVQARLLDALWPLLDINGIMMYVTCSVFPQENQDQIRAFLQRHPEAEVGELTTGVGVDCGVGRQTLPGVHDMDGFFFSILQHRTTRTRRGRV